MLPSGIQHCQMFKCFLGGSLFIFIHLATSSTSLTTSKTFCFTRGDCCAHRASLIGAPVRGVGDLQEVRQELERTILLKYVYDYMHVKTMYIYIIYLCTILYITHTSSYAKTAYKMQTLTYQVLHTICTPSKTLLRDPFICRDFVKVGCKCCQMCFERCKWPAVLPEKYQPSSTSKKTLHLQSHPHLCKFNAHLRSWDQYGVPSCKTCRWDFSLLQVYASVNLVHVYLWSDFLTEWSLHIKNHC